MTSDQTAAPASPSPQHQSYDWSNIATIRRSISRNRSNAGDRYPKYGDPIRYSSAGGYREVAAANTPKTPSRAGSTELEINTNGMLLYPHLEERPIRHNLRSTKSEYFLSPPKQSSHYHRPAYLGIATAPQNNNNIDDDTKWINSASSTASYQSSGGGSSSCREEVDDDHAHLCPEIGKPVSVVSLPPLDRGAALAYRRFATVSAGGVRGAAGPTCRTIYQQTNGGSVGDNAQSTNDLMMAVRNAQTPPPPMSLMSSHNSSVGGHQQRKCYTLNPARNQQQLQRIDRFNEKRNANHADDIRRRSMTPMITSRQDYHTGDGALSPQQFLNRSLSCYVDPLDYKVGCQNTLRSKPLIPWYELAIKDKNRRSCPQLEVITLSKSWPINHNLYMNSLWV